MSEGLASSPGHVIRARRYVSAPAGTYPAPVAPRPAAPAASPPGEPFGERPAPREDAPLPFLVGAEEVPAAAAARERPATTQGTGWGGLLLGMAVGAVVGVSLGVVLVAFFGGCEPSLAWTDPLAVWRTVTDPVIRFSGVLVAAGFALLGAALGGRRPPAPSED